MCRSPFVNPTWVWVCDLLWPHLLTWGFQLPTHCPVCVPWGQNVCSFLPPVLRINALICCCFLSATFYNFQWELQTRYTKHSENISILESFWGLPSSLPYSCHPGASGRSPDEACRDRQRQMVVKWRREKFSSLRWKRSLSQREGRRKLINQPWLSSIEWNCIYLWFDKDDSISYPYLCSSICWVMGL